MRISLVILLFIACVDTAAQVIRPTKQYSTHDGIPQIQVQDMLQDSRGYIWVATKNGAASFNGDRWESLQFPADVNPSFVKIYENKIGELIFFQKGENVNLIKYNGANFTQMDSSIYSRSKWNSFIHNDTLFNTDPIKSVFKKVDLNTFDILLERPFNYKDSLAVQGYLDGPQFINGADHLFNTLNINIEQLADDERILAWWPNFYGNHVIEYRYPEKTEFVYYDHVNKEPIFQTTLQNRILQNIEIHKWKETIFFDQNYIYRINEKNKRIDSLSLINTTNNDIIYDFDSNIWNSSENGVQYFTETHFRNFNQPELKDAWFFVPYKDNYLFANYSKGLYEVKLDPFEFHPINNDFETRYYFKPALVEDKVYIASSNFIIIYENGTVKNIDIRKYNSELLCAYYDTVDDMVYFGGKNKLLVLDPKSLNVQEIIDHEKITKSYILSIESKNEKELWIGSGSSLTIFNKEKKTFSKVEAKADDKVGGTCLHNDHNGNLWLGNRNGLWFHNSMTNSIQHIGKDYIENQVLSIQQVNDSILAIGCTDEFAILNLDAFYISGDTLIKSFNHRNGFLGEEVAQGGMFLQDSLLWIPSATKLTVVNINDLNFKPMFSNTLIRKINNQSIKWTDPDSLLNIEFGEKNLCIEFESIGFNQPKVAQYQYKLDGVDEKWTPWTSSTTARYFNLSPGSYTFSVRSKTGGFSKDDEIPITKVELEVDMPFYKTPDFYQNALFLILILGILLFALLYYLARRRKERTELEQQLNYVRAKALQSQLNPHFIFNVLSTIQSLVLKNDTEKANKALVSFSKMLRKFLDASVESEKANSKGDFVRGISLAEENELLGHYLDFQKLQLGEKLQYQIQVSKDIDEENTYIPHMIIQPIVENAVKHGIGSENKPGHVSVIWRIEKAGFIICIVEDDGPGIQNKDQIVSQTIPMFKSHGLELLHKKIAVLQNLGRKINLTHTNKESKGTKVVVELQMME